MRYSEAAALDDPVKRPRGIEVEVSDTLAWQRLRQRASESLRLEKEGRDIRDLWPEMFGADAIGVAPAPEPPDELFFGRDRDFNKEARARLLFRGVPLGTIVAADPMIARALSLAQATFPAEVWGEMVSKGVLTAAACKNWQEQFSYIGERAKKEQEGFSTHWRYLVDLTAMADYVPAPPVDVFKEQVQDWVLKRRKHNSPLGDFEGLFWDKAHEWVSKNLAPPKQQLLTIDQYSRDPLIWGLGGSSFDTSGVRTFVTLDGKTLKAPKTKWASAMALSPDNIRLRILSTAAQVGKAVVKRERKKARAVISADLNTYLKMDYVSKAWLDHALKGNTTSPIWMTDEQRSDFWRDFTTKAGVRLPLDQSAFDHNVSQKMVLAIVHAIYDLARAQVSSGVGDESTLDIVTALHSTLRCLSGGYVLVGKDRVPYKNGVLSGWKWTALIDTIANECEMEMAEDCCIWAGLGGFVSRCVQGDDVQLHCSTLTQACFTTIAMRTMGFDVNPAKTFISLTSDEFLRKVALHRPKTNARRGKRAPVLTGYPCRALGAILTRNPISRPTDPGGARLTETLGKWNTLITRLIYNTSASNVAAKRRALGLMVEDLSRGSLLPAYIVKRWLTTPSALGGGGANPQPGLAVAVTNETRKFPNIKVTPRRGLDGLEDTISRYGLDVSKAQVNDWAARTLTLPDKFRKKVEVTEPLVIEWRWLPLTAKQAAPMESYRDSSPKVRHLDQTERSLLEAFPTRENFAHFGAPCPPGTPLSWWKDIALGRQSIVSPKFLGYNWEWLAQTFRLAGRGVDHTFSFLRRKSISMLNELRATSEYRALGTNWSALPYIDRS